MVGNQACVHISFFTQKTHKITSWSWAHLMRNTLCVQVAQIFQTSKHNFKPLGASRVTWSKFHAEGLQIFGATFQNFIATTQDMCTCLSLSLCLSWALKSSIYFASMQQASLSYSNCRWKNILPLWSSRAVVMFLSVMQPRSVPIKVIHR